MKIRIFALAKELDMDSKVLIKHCNDAGIHVKSSALASISPEERDILLEHLKQAQVAAPTSAEPGPLAPMRDAAKHVGAKVRTIKPMMPRAQSPRLRRSQSVESSVAEPVAQLNSGEIAVGSSAVAVDAGAGSPVAEIEALPVESDTGVIDVPDSESATDGIVPISRDDFVAASGASGVGVREMKPRGTTPDASARQGGSKSRAKPALPNVAAPPAYKLPTVKKSGSDEAPAQKPDLRLTADVIEQQSPLAAHLRKHTEQKKKNKKLGDDVPGGASARRPAERGGSLGLVEARQQRREKRKQARQVSDDDAVRAQRGRGPRRRRQRSGAPIELKTSAQVDAPMTVRSLSEAMGRPAKALLQILFQKGQMISINESIDEETALELALELGVDLEIKRGRDIEEELVELLDAEDPEETLVPRAPIITILGHVDHGKTSLLDKIRSANVAGGEAGGITQHIASYQVEHEGQKLTFVDTPGHAAFGEMRARGANVTDIIILVVAADDGVMPQTVECISHAKASGAPVVVAMNKIDLPDTNEQKVLGDLASHGIMPHEWGGDTEVIRTSAETGEGIDTLLETLLLTAELHEFKVNPERPAVGVCLEAFRDEGRGPLTWLVVQKGTLRIGDVVLCGPAFGNVRAMYDDCDEELQEAGPSTPVMVAGLDIVPGAGDHFFVLQDVEAARQAAEDRRHVGRTNSLAGSGRPRSLDDILNAARGGAVQDLPLILKADSPGSIEALKGELEKVEHPEVRVNILHSGVGGVNESDVYLASASGAIVVAFHVIPEDRAMLLADKEGVDIRRYNIIYEVTDQIKRSLEGLLEPERVEVATGRALVLQTFHISRFGTIAGCRILTGKIERSNRVHVIRDQKVLNDYDIASLKREKDDAKEVREGMECGIRLDGFNDVKEGDLMEAYRIDIVKRTLD